VGQARQRLLTFHMVLLFLRISAIEHEIFELRRISAFHLTHLLRI